MPLDFDEYNSHPVYRRINNRFFVRYGIMLGDHIASVEKVNWRVQEGFDFIPANAAAFVQAITNARFQLDSTERSYGIIPGVGFFAALATHGQGYREQSAGEMLHCAIANDICNIHLDDTGFVLEGYNANALQHIADDLLWQDKIVKNVAKLSVPIASVLGRVHPIVPNLRQMRPLSEVGVQFDVYSRPSKDEMSIMKLTIDATHSCSDMTCGAWSAVHGKTVEGENKFMLNLQVLGL